MIWTKALGNYVKKPLIFRGVLVSGITLFLGRWLFPKNFRTERPAKLKNKQRLHESFFYFTGFFLGRQYHHPVRILYLPATNMLVAPQKLMVGFDETFLLGQKPSPVLRWQNAASFREGILNFMTSKKLTIFFAIRTSVAWRCSVNCCFRTTTSMISRGTLGEEITSLTSVGAKLVRQMSHKACWLF